MPDLDTMPANQCRACNNRRGNRETATIGVYTCAKCGAIFGQCYLGDSYGIVKPWFSPVEVPAEQARYFDLTTLGSNGVGRRHGWYDPATGLITQVG